MLEKKAKYLITKLKFIILILIPIIILYFFNIKP